MLGPRLRSAFRVPVAHGSPPKFILPCALPPPSNIFAHSLTPLFVLTQKRQSPSPLSVESPSSLMSSDVMRTFHLRAPQLSGAACAQPATIRREYVGRSKLRRSIETFRYVTPP